MEGYLAGRPRRRDPTRGTRRSPPPGSGFGGSDIRRRGDVRARDTGRTGLPVECCDAWRVSLRRQGRWRGWVEHTTSSEGTLSNPLRRAYVTLLSHGDAYVPGVEALGWSLIHTGSRVPRIAMVTEDVPAGARLRLRRQGWMLRDVDAVPSPVGNALFPRFRHVFTKLRVFGLEGLERVVFLDADTIVLQPLDELFDRSGFAAAPDFLLPDQFNSGVMALSPSTDLLERMLAALADAGSYDGGDQGFLNRFFDDWYWGPAERRLAAGYNTHHFIYQFILSHPTLRRTLEPTIRVVHYTVQKPWEDRPWPTLSGGAAAWWRQYLGAHPELNRSWRRQLRSLQDVPFERLIHWVVR